MVVSQFYTTCKYSPIGKICHMLRSNHYQSYHQAGIWKQMLPVFSILFDIQAQTLQCAKARKNLKPNHNVYFLKNPQNTEKI